MCINTSLNMIIQLLLGKNSSGKSLMGLGPQTDAKEAMCLVLITGIILWFIISTEDSTNINKALQSYMKIIVLLITS